MKKRDLKKVAVFIFIKDGKVLVEKRLKDEVEILNGEYIFPGGGINSEEDLETALKREVMEELGIILYKFQNLAQDLEIIGANKDVSLHPFLIEEWENEIPEKILDEDDPLFWVDLEVMLNSKIAPTRKIAKLIEQYLKKKGSEVII